VYGTLQFVSVRSELHWQLQVRLSDSESITFSSPSGDARAYSLPYLLQSMFQASAQIDGRLRYSASVKSSENSEMPIVRYAQKFSKRLDLPDSILLDESQSLNLCPDRRDIFCNDSHLIQPILEPESCGRKCEIFIMFPFFWILATKQLAPKS
jgi:hypothetical protein